MKFILTKYRTALVQSTFEGGRLAVEHKLFPILQDISSYFQLVKFQTPDLSYKCDDCYPEGQYVKEYLN